MPSTVGQHVRALYGAAGAKRAAELAIEDFLSSLFPEGWHGWDYHGEIHAAAIDVYSVVDSPAAASALHRAGWITVTLHGHIHGARPITCACPVRSVP